MYINLDLKVRMDLAVSPKEYHCCSDNSILLFYFSWVQKVYIKGIISGVDGFFLAEYMQNPGPDTFKRKSHGSNRGVESE